MKGYVKDDSDPPSERVSKKSENTRIKYTTKTGCSTTGVVLSFE